MKKNLLSRNVAEIAKNTKKKVIAAGTAASLTLMTALPAMAKATNSSFTAYSGTNSNQLMSGVISFFGTIGTYGGGLYGAAAVFTLILAVRNEDNEGRNKALLNLMAAIGLLSMGVILKLFFTSK